MTGLLAQHGFAREVHATIADPASAAGTAGVPNFATLTWGSAHGLRRGDVITLSGFSPSGYNATWTIAEVPSSTTAKFYTGTTLLGTGTVMGDVTGSKWGASTTPDRFAEFTSESLKLEVGRLSGKGIGAGSRVERADRQIVYPKSVSGDVSYEVLTEGFGLLFEMCMGAVATTGPGADGEYTHVFTIGDLRGKSMTYQFGRPDSYGTVRPFTYRGVKVNAWTLEVSVDNMVMLNLTLDGVGESVAVALAPASYSATAELMSYIGGSLVVDSANFDALKSMTVSGNNNLATERRFLDATAKREQLEDQMRSFAVSATAEFSDLSGYEHFAAAVPADAMATLEMTFVGPTAIGGTTYPSITVEVPNLRVDGETPNVGAAELLEYSFAGVPLNTDPSANDAITITYVTADELP